MIASTALVKAVEKARRLCSAMARGMLRPMWASARTANLNYFMYQLFFLFLMFSF